MGIILILIRINNSLKVKILLSVGEIDKVFFTDKYQINRGGIYMSRGSSLVPEAKQGLATFKNEVAQELGVPFKEYNGDLSSRQCGSVGGEMVKRMVEEYEHRI